MRDEARRQFEEDERQIREKLGEELAGLRRELDEKTKAMERTQSTSEVSRSTLND